MSESIDPYLSCLNIPLERRPPSHYDLLGLAAYEADAARIDKAAVDRAEFLQKLMNGPDRETAFRVSSEIAVAFSVLGAPDRKREYDRDLRSRDGAKSPATASQPSPAVEVAAAAEGNRDVTTGVTAANTFESVKESPSSNAHVLWSISGGVLAAVVVLGIFGAWNWFNSAPQPIVEAGNAISTGLVDDNRNSPTAQDDGQPAPTIATETKHIAVKTPMRSAPSEPPPEIPPVASPDNNPAVNLADNDRVHPELVAEKSVVRLRVRKPNGIVSGSGFVLGESIIATSFDLVENTIDVEAEFFDGTKISIDGFWAFDSQRNIVLLATPHAVPCAALQLARGKNRTGEKVFAIGAPQFQSDNARSETVSAMLTNEQIKAMVRDHPGRPDMTWLQITAHIGVDNSGGPLINAAGEVVGLNTVLRPGNSNLNFAISSDDIRRVYEQTAATAIPLARLSIHPVEEVRTAQRRPSNSRNSIEKDRRDAGENVVIALPSGAVLDVEKTFLAPFRQKRVNFKPEVFSGHYLFSTESQRGRAGTLLIAKKDVLDGPALASYESGEPATFASYSDGRRDGNVLTWDEQGQKVFFGQYRLGKESGFECLFQDGELRVVQEAFGGTVVASHIIEGNRVVKSFAKGDPLDESGKAAIAAIDDRKKRLKEAEDIVKKKVREKYGAYQKQLASTNKARSRAGIIQSAAQIEAANSAALEGLIRRAFGRP